METSRAAAADATWTSGRRLRYNGDYFDWPFMDKRCEKHGISLAAELGVADNGQGEWRGTSGSVHLDAFAWVKRDSYLEPSGYYSDESRRRRGCDVDSPWSRVSRRRPADAAWIVRGDDERASSRGEVQRIVAG